MVIKMTNRWDCSQTMTYQSPALVILYQAIGPVPLPSLRCWVQTPRQLPVSMFNFSIPSDPLPEELEAKVDHLWMIYYLYAIDHDARSLAHAREFSAEEIAKFRHAAGVNLTPIAPRPATPTAPRHLDLSLPL
jgi:hypothetical protein